MSLYENAKILLQTEYETHRTAKAMSNPQYVAYIEEKWRHSWQVAGAGNLILRNEPYFQGRDSAFWEKAKTAVLLHDVFRFREARLKFEENKKIDHGLCGAAFLKTLPEFNDVLIWLPIKHHGHMIEDLYADAEYQALPEGQLKEDVRHIAFLVRDADKIANWQILTNEFDAMRIVWLPFPDDFSKSQAPIMPKLWAEFCKCRVPQGRFLDTNVSSLLSTFSWIFDMNYQSSVVFCKKLNLFEKFYGILNKFQPDPLKMAQIRQIVSEYVEKRFQLKIG